MNKELKKALNKELSIEKVFNMDKLKEIIFDYTVDFTDRCKALNSFIKLTSKKANYSNDDVFTKARDRDLVWLRMIVFQYANKVLDFESDEIGVIFNRSTSAVKHALKMYKVLESDKKFKEFLVKLEHINK